MAAEESDGHRYAVLFEPLDGSANLDVGGSVGSIFSIFEVPASDEHLLQAGGMASTGTRDSMDVEPTELHQRVPVILGSKTCVSALVAKLQEG